MRVLTATMPCHHRRMNRFPPLFTCIFLCLAGLLLPSCAGKNAGERLADMPQWLGGMPPGVPPRRGTPEYDAWTAARAQEAARPKTQQSK
ncbi:MAG: hypothetical protein Q7J60_16330 [Bradyrhizobium sp.]|nr:hypothetical protein [Bradyrhizobium sp.]